MADGLSIAASAIQVADSGFKLYGALSQYVKDFRDANKHCKRLADEVRTTSWALQQLGSLLDQDNDLRLCKPEAISETREALRGCKTAFDEVSEVFGDSLSRLTDGGVGTLSMPGRLKWPFKKSKIVLLLAQLERLKTTLLLVFKVLSYASKIASAEAQHDVVLMDEKTQLRYLVKAKQEAVRTEQSLLATNAKSMPQPPHNTLPVWDESLPPSYSHEAQATSGAALDHLDAAHSLDRSIITARESDQYKAFDLPGRPRALPMPNSHSFFIGAAAMASNPPNEMMISQRGLSNTLTQPMPAKKPPSNRKLSLVTQLDACAAAVARLSSTLEQAKDHLRLNDSLEVHHVKITKRFRNAQRAVDDLMTANLEANSDSGSGTNEEHHDGWQPRRERHTTPLSIVPRPAARPFESGDPAAIREGCAPLAWAPGTRAASPSPAGSHGISEDDYSPQPRLKSRRSHTDTATRIGGAGATAAAMEVSNVARPGSRYPERTFHGIPLQQRYGAKQKRESADTSMTEFSCLREILPTLEYPYQHSAEEDVEANKFAGVTQETAQGLLKVSR